MGACLCCKTAMVIPHTPLSEDQSVIRKQYKNCGYITEVRRSEIYKLKNIQTGKFVTCKQTPRRRYKRCQHETKILKLFNSKCLPKFIDTELLTNGCYLYYEYIPGEDVFDAIFNDTKENILELTLNEIKILFEKMVDCLIECKRYGIVHLDIKFENYIFDKKTNRMYLIDFESARPLLGINDLYKIPTYFGTYAFMAPENWFFLYHNNSDVWNLGVCLWALLIKKYPFDIMNLTRTTDDIHNVIKFRCIFPSVNHMNVMKNENFDNNLKDILGRMFVFDPRNRITLEEVKAHPWLN